MQSRKSKLLQECRHNYVVMTITTTSISHTLTFGFTSAPNEKDSFLTLLKKSFVCLFMYICISPNMRLNRFFVLLLPLLRLLLMLRLLLKLLLLMLSLLLFSLLRCYLFQFVTCDRKGDVCGIDGILALKL